jgi:hypothetical protein
MFHISATCGKPDPDPDLDPHQSEKLDQYEKPGAVETHNLDRSASKSKDGSGSASVVALFRNTGLLCKTIFAVLSVYSSFLIEYGIFFIYHIRYCTHRYPRNNSLSSHCPGYF